MLEISNLVITRYQQPLLKIDKLAVKNGELIALMGSSGSGKSTFLAAICGTLDSAFSFYGRISLNQIDIHNMPTEKRRVGILFQDDLLFPHMSVEENIAFAVPPYIKKHERQKIISDSLESVGLDDLKTNDPSRLSGGQRTRASLARALLAQPKTLLLDEPFANLDADLKKNIQDLIAKHIKNYNLPSIMVTHDETETKAMNCRVFEIKDKTIIAKS